VLAAFLIVSYVSAAMEGILVLEDAGGDVQGECWIMQCWKEFQ
jgi:hypothetical protein